MTICLPHFGQHVGGFPPVDLSLVEQLIAILCFWDQFNLVNLAQFDNCHILEGMFTYLVSEFIAVLLGDWCWNCSRWVSEGSPGRALGNAEALVVLLVKHAEALFRIPAVSSAPLYALGLMQKMRRNGQLVLKIKRQQNNVLPHSSNYLTIQRKGHHPDRSPSRLLLELRKEISTKTFQKDPTLTFPVAGNGVVVVHGFGKALIEDASIWAAVPLPPPLPVETGVFGLATR